MNLSDCSARSFLETLMARCDFPDDAKDLFLNISDQLTLDSSRLLSFNRIVSRYMEHQPGDGSVCIKEGRVVSLTPDSSALTKYPLNQALLDSSNLLSALPGSLSQYTKDLFFLLSASAFTLADYRAHGLSDDFFYENALDFHSKLSECKRLFHEWGTFVSSWFGDFLKLRRFALGRFQFAFDYFREPCARTLKSGRVLNPGDLILRIHIPAHGQPLTDDVRHASYKQAAQFFAPLFPNGTVLTCHSWLLYPPLKDMLPEKSHIIRFMNDFEITDSDIQDPFRDAFRIWGDAVFSPIETWPETTLLQKSYKQFLMAGNPGGFGNGFIEIP